MHIHISKQKCYFQNLPVISQIVWGVRCSEGPTSHLTPYTLHLKPYTSNVTPNTLHLIPYTLHLKPYTSQLTSQTLQTAHQLESSVAQQHFQDFLSSDLAEFEFEKY